MSVATGDLDTQRREGKLTTFRVAAAVLLYAGVMAALDADGNVVPAEDDAAQHFVGIVREQVDNSAGDAGDLDVELEAEGTFLLTGADFSASDVGKPVYVVDDATIGLADATDHQVMVGHIVEWVSATKVWVRLCGERKQAEVRQWTLEVAGVNAAAVDLSSLAADYGGTDFYILEVVAARADVTSTGAAATVHRKVATTHWTLADGVLSMVGNETANTWLLTFRGYLV